MIRERLLQCRTAEEVVEFFEGHKEKKFIQAIDILKPNEVAHVLTKMGALWMDYFGPVKERPHACLTSGKHSDGFVNLGDMLKKFPAIRWGLAQNLAWMAQVCVHPNLEGVWVTGADTSSTALAGDVAKILEGKQMIMIKTTMAGGEKMQGVDLASGADYDGVSPILHIEELITTSSSALQVREGIRNSFPKATFLKTVLVIVDRSDPDHPVELIEDSTIAPLLRIGMRNYEPGECPYCRAGSEAIAPKEGDNWRRLMSDE